MKSAIETPKLVPFLRIEREQTDVSLTAERGKTDDSLFDLRKKAEQETDATVKSDRKKADRERAQHREDVDRKESTNARNQRIKDDKNVQVERSKVDAAILVERNEKDRVLVEFLLRERSDTDESLTHERDQTDIAVQKSSKLLTDEVGLHTKTKAELTTRDELLAIVSHDLRNPIGSVLSCADMLLVEPEFASVSPEVRYWIDMIKRNAETSLRLIADILDTERIAEGKLVITPKLNSLSKVLRESIEPFAHVASANRIFLRVVLTEEDVEATFDRDRIAQVLSNLIGNALKFTPEGGTVAVGLSRENTETVVTVCDTGKGVPDAEKERIFVRYAQIGKKDRRGLGLGLYISKTLIESHGGRLWVSDAPERGSIFHFSLPTAKRPSADQ